MQTQITFRTRLLFFDKSGGDKLKIAINYSDKKFAKSQRYNTKTAYKRGKFDKVIEYSPDNIDKEFKKKYNNILTKKRGGGYWLWKPYIIYKTMKDLTYGDYLFYCDSGVYYINSIDYLIKCLEINEQDIMIFDLPLIEKQWTKMDAFLIMNCLGAEYTDKNQRLASFFLMKKTDLTMKFLEDYLYYCCNDAIISDNENICGKDNDKYFIDHRHDQSILSLLSNKYKLKAFRDPSQFGENPQLYVEGANAILKNKKVNSNYYVLHNEKVYVNCNYPQILVHYRGSELKKVRLERLIPNSILAIYKKAKKMINKL